MVKFMENGSWFESPLRYHKVRYCTVPYGTVLYRTVRYGTVAPEIFRGGGTVASTEKPPNSPGDVFRSVLCGPNGH